MNTPLDGLADTVTRAMARPEPPRGIYLQLYRGAIKGPTREAKRDQLARYCDAIAAMGLPGVVMHGFCEDLAAASERHAVDLVIFDEASQITVPEAIGALGRARAAVIVGDSKQMPPTRRVGGGASDEEIDDADADEILEDQESILSECELARVPTLSLSWHYRSQDEQLIAF